MGLKTAGVGHFQIPTAPAAGVSVVSGTANALTGTAIVLSASVSAMYITGVHVETSAALAATYILVQLCVGGSGAETSIGQYLVPLSTGSTVALGYRQIYPPIPMAAGARLSVKTADSVGSKTYLVTAECILATNVVDDGITVGTVNLCNTLTTYTGDTPQTGDAFARIGAAGAGLTAVPTFGDFTSTQKTSLSAATPTVTLANGAHGGAAATMTLGGAGGLTATHTGNTTGSVGSVTGAVGSVTGAVGSVTGAVGSVTGAVGSVTGAVGSVTGNVGGNVVGSVASVTAGVSLAASQHVIVDSGTVTTLTNLPPITANWITAAGITAGALNGKGDWSTLAAGAAMTLTAAYDAAKTAAQAGNAMTLTGLYDAAKTAATQASVDALPSAAQNATALLATAVDGTTTVAESVRLANSALGGKASGLAGTTAVFRDLADTKDRLTATVDASGNRTAVVRNLT